MTTLLPSMAFPVRVASSPVVTVPGSQPSPGEADLEARRLAAAVARGEEAGFRELYDRYQPRLFRLALVLCHGDGAFAQDILQSVFLTAAKKLRAVNTEEHLWNWLALVVRQQVAKAWRGRQRDAAVVTTADLPEKTAPSEPDSILEERLDAALLELAEEDRQLLEWFYFDDLSQKEIAVRLSATPKAVSSRLERARTRLRSLLAHKFSYES